MDMMEQDETSCWDWDTETLCLKLYNACCCSCCNCCCFKHLSRAAKDSKHPHIHYGQLVEQQETKEPLQEEQEQQESEQSGSEGRSYRYPQKYREYTIPPQLVREGEGVVVRQQPRATARSISEVKASRYSPVTAARVLSRSIAQLPSAASRTQFPYSASRLSPIASGTRLSPIASRTRLSHSASGDTLNTVDTQSADSYDSMDEEAMIGYVEKAGKRPSLFSTIDRSPEHTLERGKHIEFPRRKLSLFTIKKLDPILMKKLEVLQPSSDPPDITGVHFSLSFDEQKSLLIVHIIHAINLPTQRPEESSSPFVQLYLLPSKTEVQLSHSIEGTLSPYYDRLFTFTKQSLEALRCSAVIMRFYVNTNHFIGGILYGLQDADLMGNRIVHTISPYDEEEGLKEYCQGDILLTICYHSTADVLEILVLEISNLKKQDFLRSPNPYVKINLLYQGQRVVKMKTSHLKGATNPIFNEVFEIDIGSMNLEELQLDLVVMNYDRLGHNNEIGGVSFGDNVAHKSGCSHWNKLMIETNSDITMWHPLLPMPSYSDTQMSPAGRASKKSGGLKSKSPSHSPSHYKLTPSQFRTPAQGCFRVTPPRR